MHLGVSADQRSTLRTETARGAVEEDDNPRSVGHFFDPVHSVPLEVPFPLACARIFATAEEWALLPNEATSNAYTLPLAKEQYVATITGPNPGQRDEHLRNLFLDLGHAIHLVQDMAQPEHTRNDQHLPAFYQLYGGDTVASVWENWGAENLIVTDTSPTPVVSYEGYPNVILRDYADYFHTADGKGMADFSNRGFVTQDTNYQDEKVSGKCQYYSQPSIDDASERVDWMTEEYRDDQGRPRTELVQESIWTSFPMDKYAGIQETDPFHDFKSIIDFESRQKGAPTYSLSEGSYLSRASLLVPRAVGYSAGFIDHFFRGSVDVKWQRAANYSWDLKVINTSAERIGDDARIESVLRTDPAYFGRTNTNDTAPILARQKIADYVPGFSGMAPGESITIPSVQIPDLIPGDSIRSFDRRTVITGTLGSEADAVIGLVQQGGPHKLRAEVTWQCNGCLDPGPMIGVTRGIGCNILIGPAFSYRPLYCNPFEGSQACITQAPRRDGSVPAILTIDKTNPETDYFFAFYNTQGGSADVTLKIYIDDELDRTIRNTVDLTSFTQCARFAQYP
jgi:hypothetical protein